MKKLFTLIAIVVWTFSVVEMSAQTICPDQTFGTNGIFINQLSPYGSAFRDIELLSNGKIVAVGEFEDVSGYDILFATFKPDGTLDSSLVTPNGFLTYDVGLNENETVEAIANSGDSIFYIAGSFFNGTNQDVFIAKVDTTGILDMSFGSNGFFLFDVQTYDDYLKDIIVQSDGKIVACGYTNNGTNTEVLIIRLNADGTFDTTFDSDGIINGSFGVGSYEANSIALKSTGQYVVGGEYGENTVDGILVAQLNSDGSLDLTFNSTGYLLQDLSANTDAVNDIKLDNNEDIIAVGSYNLSFVISSNNSQFFIARIFADGYLDPTFDTDGIANADFGPYSDLAYTVEVQPDNKYIVGGYSWLDSTNTTSDFAVARFNWNGQLDNTFDQDGILTYSLGSEVDQLASIEMQPDGKVISAGASMISTVYNAALIRTEICPCITTYDTLKRYICNGDSYLFNGHTYLVDGTYLDTLISTLGCDSIIVTNLITVASGNIVTDTINKIIHDGINCRNYAIVKIGNQWWMQENVNATKYSDGTPLVDGTGVGNITGDYTTKYVFNYENIPDSSEIYGKLYTWAAVMNDALSSNSVPSGVQGVCPSGWHVPSDTEWQLLVDYLGGISVAGGKMKEVGFEHWSAPNNGATNESGFTAIPGGIRYTNGVFEGVNSYAYWWTSTDSSSSYAWKWGILGYWSDIYRNYYNKDTGKSIRCVQDNLSNDLAISSIIINSICNGSSTGSIDITVSGGTSPYSYVWSNTATAEDLTNIPAGTYYVTVTDASSATLIDTFYVTEPSQIVLSTSSTNATCSSTDGTATVTPTGGVSPYTYLWSDLGSQTTSTATGLYASVFKVTVTDTNGCQDSTMVIVDNLSGPSVAVTSYTNVNCFGNATGSATITVSGGTPNYEYTWSNGYSTMNDPSTTSTATGLAAGTYTVTCMDLNGCSGFAILTITEPPQLAVSKVVTNVSCAGFASGSIDVTPAGGFGTYYYNWSNTSTFQDISSLVAGVYTLTLTDANSCSITDVTTITAPAMALTLGLNLTNISCFGANDGLISSTVSGGTSPYSYSWSNSEVTSTISNLPAGTYTLTVTDANGCIKSSMTNTYDPPQMIVNAGTDQNICSGGSVGLSVSASGGYNPYTYSWSPAGSLSNPNIQNPISSATANEMYVVTVTDATSCSLSDTVYVGVTPAITVFAGNDQTVATTNVSLSGSVSGGTSTGVWSTSGGGTFTPDNTVLNAVYILSAGDVAAGIVTLTLTSSNNGACNPVADNVIITYNAPILSVASSATNVYCGNCNGTATAIASGGTSPYNYVWSNSQTTQSITGLCPGSYIVTVTDALSANVIDTIIVDEVVNIPDASFKAALISNSLINTNSDNEIQCSEASAYTGIIKVNSLNISDMTGIEAFVVLTELSCDTNQISSIDVSFNTSLTSLIVSNNSLTSLDVSNNTALTHLDLWGNQVATIDVSTNTALVYFSCSSNNITSIDISNNLALESFFCINNQISSLNVSNNTNLKNLFCNLNNLTTLDVSTNIYLEDLRCFYNNLTTLDVSANPLLFDLWCSNNQITMLDISANPAIVYLNAENNQLTSLNAKNGNNVNFYEFAAFGNPLLTCIQVDNAAWSTANWTNIDAGASFSENCNPASIVISSNVTNVSCFGLTDGAVDITVTGGTAPYSYLWSSGVTTEDLTGIIAGTYTVTVTDAAFLTQSETVTITEPALLQLLVSNIVDASCNYSDGNITINAIGGSIGYSVLWETGGTSFTESNLYAGAYSVTLTDAHGCNIDTILTVNNIAGPVVDSISFYNPICFGDLTGLANVNYSGGTPPIDILWDSNAGSSTFSVVTNLGAGNYFVTLTDAINCQAVASVTITEPDSLAASFSSQTNVDCFGASTGSAALNVIGGTTPYSYNWSDGSTSSSISSAVAGYYTATITDSHSCHATAYITISEPAQIALSALITDVTTNGGSDGAINVTVIGGTSPYTFSWSTSDISEDLANIPAGMYYLSVFDNYSCQFDTSFEVLEPASIISVASNITNVSCFGLSDGSIDITPTGGQTPYSYVWSNGGASTSLSALSAGVYIVTITDANSEILIKTFTIAEPSELIASISSQTDVSCFGLDDGSLISSVTGGTTPYNYAWSDAQTSDIATNLMAGNYGLTVSDANLCESVVSANIVEPTEMLLSSSITDVSCGGTADGSIDVTVTGGTTPYTFIWSNGSSTEDIANLAVGNYSITVQDANLCELTQDFIVSSGANIIVSETVNNISCFGANDGSVSLNISGGNPPYLINWSNGSTSNILTGLAPGTYTVTISDGFPCTRILTYNITQPLTGITATSVSTTLADCNYSCSGSATLTISGGTSPYSYLWSGGQTSNPAQNMCPGMNTVTITDANGCFKQYSVQVNIAPLSKIRGNIYYSGILMPVDAAIVELWKETTANNSGKVKVGDLHNVSNGYYEFSGLASGTYYVKAKVLSQGDFPNTLPTWYDTAHQWFNATPIILGCNVVQNININMLQVPAMTNGNTSIHGQITLATYNKSILGEPIPGAEITLEQEPDDEPIISTSSGNDGTYDFMDIPNASYIVVVDIPGYTQFETYNITVNPEDTSINNINFVVDTTDYGLGIYINHEIYVPLVDGKYLTVNVFPNPFTENVNIEFTLEESANVSVDILDELGKQIINICNENKSKGKHKFDFNYKLPAGIYFVKISVDNTVYVKKLVKK